MYRYILTALTAGMILLAFAVLPPIVSGSALAQKKDPTTDALNLNTSRSNIYRSGAPTDFTEKGGKGKGNQGSSSVRMGGGGGGARMGGGGGTTTNK